VHVWQQRILASEGRLSPPHSILLLRSFLIVERLPKDVLVFVRTIFIAVNVRSGEVHAPPSSL
jgi:hypothetical protein